MRLFFMLLPATALYAFAQTTTKIDLATQARNVDFSMADNTRPVKVGGNLPATCVAGEMYFLLGGLGQNLYGCTSVNAWTVLGGSGGSSENAFAVNRTSNTVLTINTGCSVTSPCNYRSGSAVTSFTSPAMLTLTQSTMATTVYIYISGGGELVAGHGPGVTLNCNGCVANANIVAFPPDSVPLYTWVGGTVSGQWDASGSDYRARLSTTVLEPGIGVTQTSNPVTGRIKIGLDPALVGVRVPVPGSSTSSCSPQHWALDSNYVYLCVAPNTWRRAALATW